MKMAVRAMLVALATLALASPSFAATVAPTSYPFILKVDSFGSLYVIMSFIGCIGSAMKAYGPGPHRPSRSARPCVWPVRAR